MERTKLHELPDIFVIAICAIVCGADDWTEVELFGNAKLSGLRTFVELPNGIPSHDTFGRVFARLNPEQFQQCFLEWTQAVSAVTGGQVIAIDGKVLRHSCARVLGKAGIAMVNAWATANHMMWGKVKVDDKSNEITAIPKLLQVLDIVFDEDHQRVRKDNGQANFAVLRHIALKLLKQDKPVKAGVKAKRLKADWDEPYWLKVLFGQGN
jgi:DDE_Tnp_1-associated